WRSYVCCSLTKLKTKKAAKGGDYDDVRRTAVQHEMAAQYEKALRRGPCRSPGERLGKAGNSLEGVQSPLRPGILPDFEAER
ncbi:hypothetical protein K3X02_14955, partial [Listeria monocytogenes]|nr:hypothetical protein [Listeria monocytogenes]